MQEAGEGKKVALITAATIGVGREIALALARDGFDLVLGGRSPDRLRDAQSWLAERVPGVKVEGLRADLQVLDEVLAAARDLARRLQRLDVLVLSAEVRVTDPHLTIDGWESTFAVNHLSQFALTRELLPALRAAHGRVVVVSNAAHARGHYEPDRFRSLDSFDAYRSFADSKLANLLFVQALTRREPTLSVNALHPGELPASLLAGDFGARGPETVLHRADTAIWLATAPEARRLHGAYCVQKQPHHPSTLAQDPALAEALWRLSEEALAGR